ncbi:MAG: lysophospholipid acyltransferase family protein [Thermoanaerobaculia bacterium]
MGASRRGNPLDDWRISPLSLLLSGLIRAIAATVTIRFHDDATIRQWERARRPFILAFWHRHLVLMRYAYRGMRMNVLVSQSWDGELTSRTLGRLGIDTVRGSSSRGGANALRGAVRLAREGSDLAFTPDGPRGPLRVVQPGVVLAGMLTRLPVIPVAIGASRFRLLGSWDRMLVPLPGARVEIVYGEPLQFLQGEIVEEATARLGTSLGAVEARADRLAAEPS